MRESEVDMAHLTKEEQKICDKYSAVKDGRVNCPRCPMVMDVYGHECLATADGRLKETQEFREKVLPIRIQNKGGWDICVKSKA